MKYDFKSIGSKEDYDSNVLSKFDQPIYKEWLTYYDDTPIPGNKNLQRLGNNVGQNACYSIEIPLNVKVENLIVSSNLQICISAVGQYATMYLLTRLKWSMLSGKYIFPYTRIFDPVGEHVEIFDRCWEYVQGFGDYQFIPGWVCHSHIGLPQWAENRMVYDVLFGTYNQHFSQNTMIKDGIYRPDNGL